MMLIINDTFFFFCKAFFFSSTASLFLLHFLSFLLLFLPFDFFFYPMNFYNLQPTLPILYLISHDSHCHNCFCCCCCCFFALTKRSHRRKEKVTRNKRSCTKGKKKVAEVNVPTRPAYNKATYHYMCKSIKITIYKNYTFNINMCQHCFTLWHHHKYISMVILFQWPISELLLASSSKQCSSFHLVISFYSHAKLTHFHTNGGATGLVLKKRHR